MKPPGILEMTMEESEMVFGINAHDGRPCGGGESPPLKLSSVQESAPIAADMDRRVRAIGLQLKQEIETWFDVSPDDLGSCGCASAGDLELSLQATLEGVRHPPGWRFESRSIMTTGIESVRLTHGL